MNIAVIGKTGSGKSTITKFFVEKGYTLVDLDRIGKDVINIYPQILENLLIHFGEGVFDNGILNRKKLGEIVFNSKEKLEVLNKIFRPFIKYEVEKLLTKNKKCIIDGYGLMGLQNKIQKVICVETEKDILLERLVKREPWNSRELLSQRINIQKIDKRQCDVVIKNNGTEKEFFDKINEYFEKIKRSNNGF